MRILIACLCVVVVFQQWQINNLTDSVLSLANSVKLNSESIKILAGAG